MLTNEKQILKVYVFWTFSGSVTEISHKRRKFSAYIQWIYGCL